MSHKFILTDGEFSAIIDSLDETAGFLIKESELRYWVEFFANKHVEEVEAITRRSTLSAKAGRLWGKLKLWVRFFAK